MQNLVYEWMDFQNVPKIGSNLRKDLEKSGDFAQNLTQTPEPKLKLVIYELARGEWATFS